MTIIVPWTASRNVPCEISDFEIETHTDKKNILACETIGRKPVLILPCAPQGTLKLEDAELIVAGRARFDNVYVIEGGNGSITRDAEELLKGHGIRIVPDVLANGSGVTVSIFGKLKNHEGVALSKEETL